jgi:hypothetical protein
MRRKILMGVLAVALPLGSVAALQTIASAKTPVPPDPARSCKAVGTVHFQAPGLSKHGSVSTTLKKSTTTASITINGGCTGSVPTVSIVSKNTKCKGANDPAGTACTAKGQFSYDTESSFASTGTSSIQKSLKKLTFTVDGVTYQTKTTSATSITCNDAVAPPGGIPTEVGFKVIGTVKKPKQDKAQTSTFNACLGTDTGPGTSGSFFSDLGSGNGTIATAAIDGNTSTLTIH